MEALSERERGSFWRVRRALLDEYQPQTAQEKMLVDRIAIQHFRLLRLYRLEHQSTSTPIIPGKLNESVVPHLDRFSRYEFQVNRQIRILYNRLATLYVSRGDYSISKFLTKE